MAHISKEEYVQYMANSLSLPPGLIEKILAPRRAGDEKDGGWKIVKMPTLADLESYGLESRFASAGWRTIMRSLLED
ncbi:MAG: hypothetical protein HY267_04560 [Deltaproteobacteria bacterium]|nr:hypothetical protein [Deltaproteobacteria bacterium]